MTSQPGPGVRFPFAFSRAYRAAALPFGITPRTAWVEVRPSELLVRFGPWRLRTGIENIDAVQETGGFAFVKTAGPPHLSFTDRGISFATNGERAVCLTFHEPVPGIDPLGVLRHPGATLTVADPDGLRLALGRS